MKRLLLPACAVFVLLLLGCRSRAPLTDPFVSPTCIAPPGTGVPSTVPGDPYYRGAPPSFTPGQAIPGNVSPGMGTLQAAPGATGYPAAIPGGVGYQPQAAPAAAVAMTEPPLMASADRPGAPVAGRQRYTRVLQPRTASVPSVLQAQGTVPVPVTPAAAAARGNPVDIRALPDARKSSALQPQPLPVEDDSARPLASAKEKWVDPNVRLASAEEPLREPAAAVDTTVPADTTGLYEHSADYTLLKGRLEFSQIDQRWKLRYIPVDGQTDDYGGSVVVADAKALSGYERGDYVEVRGRLGEQADGESHFAPEFHLSEIKRITR